MAKTAAKPTKTKRKTAPKAASQTAPRLLKKPNYKSFQLQKRIKGAKLPSVFKIMRQTVGILAGNWRLIGGIVFLFGLFNMLLVRGFSAANDLSTVKSNFDQAAAGATGQVVSGLSSFVYLLGSSGNTDSPTAGVYQLILMLIFSLVLIWGLRQLYAGNKVRIRDGFYRGVAPLVQFVLVLCVVGLQLLPMIVGLLLYTTVSSGGIAATSVEQLLWAIFLFVTSVISLYMVTSSLFALYIVTLPDMTPIRALRSARQLVRYRRWTVLRKIVFLPAVLVLVAGLIIIPCILLATSVAVWMFFAVTMLLLPIAHGYMYTLYRELL